MQNFVPIKSCTHKIHMQALSNELRILKTNKTTPIHNNDCSLIFLFLNKICLLKVSLLLYLLKLFSLFLFLLNYFLNLFTLVNVFRVEFLNLLLLIKFHLQFLLLHSLLMGQSFSQVMPFELWQVFEIPHIFRVEIMFFLNHLLSIQSHSC